MIGSVRTLKRSLPPAWQRLIDRRVQKWIYLDWIISSEGTTQRPFLRNFKPALLTYVAICLRRGLSPRRLSIPPNAKVKATAIRSYARRFTTSIFVETGTFKGETVAAVAENFDRSITIELSE